MTDHTALKEAAELRKSVIETGLEIIANQPTGMTLTEWCDFSNAILEILAENEALREAVDAAKMAKTRLERRADRCHNGMEDNTARDWSRAIWASFSDFDTALEARALTEKQSALEGEE